MPDKEEQRFSASELRQRALSRWDNEGGAGRDGSKKSDAHVLPDPDIRNLTDERGQLGATTSDVATLGRTYVHVIDPRTYGVNLSASF